MRRGRREMLQAFLQALNCSEGSTKTRLILFEHEKSGKSISTQFTGKEQSHINETEILRSATEQEVPREQNPMPSKLEIIERGQWWLKLNVVEIEHTSGSESLGRIFTNSSSTGTFLELRFAVCDDSAEFASGLLQQSAGCRKPLRSCGRRPGNTHGNPDLASSRPRVGPYWTFGLLLR